MLIPSGRASQPSPSQKTDSLKVEKTWESAERMVEVERWRVKNAEGADGSVAFYHGDEPVQFKIKGGYVEVSFDDLDRDSAMELRRTLARNGMVQEVAQVTAGKVPPKPGEDEADRKVPRVEVPASKPIKGELKSAEEVARDRAIWTLRHPDAQEDSGPDAEAELQVNGKPKRVTLKAGRVETDDFELKEYLIKTGYQLVKTVPKD